MSTQKQIDRLIAQRASEWVEILKTAGPEEHEAFVDWLRESRRHVAEFLSMVALDRELDGVDIGSAVNRRALLARLSPHVSEMQRPSPAQSTVSSARRRGAWRRMALTTAATVAISVTGISLFLLNKPASENLVARASEQRAVELADGSVVQLNAGSRVTTHLSEAARDLELVQGEALFKVARDAHRPFRVRVGTATVEALGTQFNINALPSGTVVSVLEGKVRVTDESSPENPQTLIAGEGVLIDAAGALRRNGTVDVDTVVAWRQKRLVFQKTPLEEVIRQFNSHNVSPKLRLDRIEPGSRHYSATFDVDDPESFAVYLSREPDLAIDHRDGEILIQPR